MPEVIIDGITYRPNAGPRIGIGVTTRNRCTQVRSTVERIQAVTPDARIVIVDDATEGQRPTATFRFDTQQGIARAKNKCIELLMDAGVDHLFLFDDDCWPKVEDWWVPYVESREPHLMYQFQDLKNRKLGDITPVYSDKAHVAYSGVRGCMLYAHRSVIEKVGGMDPVFGVWGYEHVDWSNRIHNAGLTSWRYGDVAGSADLIHSMDEHEAVERSVPGAEREALVKVNAGICNDRRDSGFAGYVDYREASENVVITSLLAGVPDTQREGAKMTPDTAHIEAWVKSILKVGEGARPIVLTNHFPLKGQPMPGATFSPTECVLPVYFQRWLSAWQWLRTHTEVNQAWITDGTDVEMLHAPWAAMEPGVLYLGHEDQVVGCGWMVNNHKPRHLQEFFTDHANRTLLNAGLVGGEREVVMDFIHRIVRHYFDHQANLFHNKTKHSLGVGDMGVFNFEGYAYEREGKRIQYGPNVNTRFKADERNGHSWWKHK